MSLDQRCSIVRPTKNGYTKDVQVGFLTVDPDFRFDF